MIGGVKSKVKMKSDDRVHVERTSDAFSITLKMDILGSGAKVKSGFGFTDDFLSDFCFGLEVSKDGYESRDLLKNIGFALGEGLRALHDRRKSGKTSAKIVSDGKKTCMIAMNTERGPECNLQVTGEPEGFRAEDLFDFFDGFSQGFSSEFNLFVNFGKSKKNQVRFISKAFSNLIKRMFF